MPGNKAGRALSNPAEVWILRYVRTNLSCRQSCRLLLGGLPRLSGITRPVRTDVPDNVSISKLAEVKCRIVKCRWTLNEWRS